MAVVGADTGEALNGRKANFFLVAAVVIVSSYPEQSDVLRAAADRHVHRTGTRSPAAAALEV